MTGQPPGQWGSWPQPPRPERRFGTGAVVGGAVLGLVATVGLPALLASLPGFGALLFFPAGLAPLVAGIVLAASSGPPQRRGLGLGLVIGWGATLVVGAGVCIALLASFNG
jgi:hypothetical protein